MKKRIALVAVALLIPATLFALDRAAANAERKMNGVHRTKPYQPTSAGAALHRELFIADLHADPLLWNRDLNERAQVGHIDVPRLIEGNVGLQVFGVVTKTPGKMSVDSNDDSTDSLTLLFAAQRRPPKTLVSLKARALHQAAELQRNSEASGGRLSIVRTRADLDAFVAARASRPETVSALLSLEGLHALEGDVGAVDELFASGYRMFGVAHFFDNDFSGSAHGVRKEGLSEKGRALVARAESLGVTLDLAHGSATAFDEVMAMAKKPVVVSHTGVKATCDNNRNLTDAQLRRVAKNGGVVGIGYWKTATCGTDVKAIAKAIRHAVKVAGVDHVALGSDFDGAVTTPFDASGLVEVTDALLASALDPSAIAKVMGGNVLRVLRANLPAE